MCVSGAGEMVQGLRALDALPEDPSSAPGIHVVTLAAGESVALFWLLLALA